MSAENIWILAVLVFFIAGLIKGLVGIGLPTVVVASLSQVADPRFAIALLIMPLMITNLRQWLQFGRFGYLLKHYWPFAVTLVLGVWTFTRFAADAPLELLTLVVGLFILIFVASSVLTKPFHIPRHWDRPAQILGGAVAGVMGGLASLWAPPLVMYLSARNLEKEELIGALGFFLVVGSLPLAFGYWQAGLFGGEAALHSGLMLIPAMSGMWIGERWRRFLSADQFRTLLLAVFFLLGINLVLKALGVF